VSTEYDVAFSFLGEDESPAVHIADQVRDRMNVFVYSEQQKGLAGKDGLTEFTATFRERSKVCVVLYRERYGHTKWTRVEETAIKERALESGWDFLLVISLDGTAPVWLPKTKLWLGFERFGVSGAGSVIDAKVTEAVGIPKIESPRSHAERIARAAERQTEHEAILQSQRGVAMAGAEVERLFTTSGMKSRPSS
jgi:hypothetical protein